MKPINYGLSFISGKKPENSVRFWIESRIRVIDEQTKIVEDYYQCGSCKSEDTFAEKNLFYKDNYDFIPVFGPKYGIIFRRKAYLNQNYKECLKSENIFNGQIYKTKEPEIIVKLETNEFVRKATHDAIPIVAQTVIYSEYTGQRVILEYPVKTMNINDNRNLYQVDTGPVLLPDLTKRYERFVDSIRLAFVAFNASDFADFVIEQPTSIIKDSKEVCQVYHYSKIVSLTAQNSLYAIIK
jgi:hypothetical protein